MLRVYHFILDHRIGGPHVYVDTLRRALAERVESVIVTTGRGPMTEVALLNLRHLWTPLYVVELLLNALLLVVAVLVGRIRRHGAVFNVHGGANLAPLMAARLVGAPVVWHIHETTPAFRRLVALGRRIVGGRRHAIAVVAERAREVYGLDKSEFLPASVDTAFWSRTAVSVAEMGRCAWIDASSGSCRPLRLLTVGNLNPLKGGDVLIEALAGVQGPWHLQIVGAELSTHRGYAETLRQRAAEIGKLHPGSRIDFLGWQDKEAVRTLLATCDAFVLPSRSEACPIALLEAMAMGCRCLAADVGDVRHILTTCPGAVMFQADSVADCRRAIEALILTDTVWQPGEDCTGPAWRLSNVVNATEALYARILETAQ